MGVGADNSYFIFYLSVYFSSSNLQHEKENASTLLRELLSVESVEERKQGDKIDVKFCATPPPPSDRHKGDTQPTTSVSSHTRS